MTGGRAGHPERAVLGTGAPGKKGGLQPIGNVVRRGLELPAVSTPRTPEISAAERMTPVEGPALEKQFLLNSLAFPDLVNTLFNPT